MLFTNNQRQGVILNFGNLDFDIVSTVRCPVEDLDTYP